MPRRQALHREAGKFHRPRPWPLPAAKHRRLHSAARPRSSGSPRLNRICSAAGARSKRLS